MADSSTGRLADNIVRPVGRLPKHAALQIPADIGENVSGVRTLGDHLVHDPREQLLDHLHPSRQKAMRVTALWHAAPLLARLGKVISLDDGDA